MSKNNLYVWDNHALLIVGFTRVIADQISLNFETRVYNMYTDFTIPIHVGKFDLLYVYKKDDLTELPMLGLSAKQMKYLRAEDF